MVNRQDLLHILQVNEAATRFKCTAEPETFIAWSEKLLKPTCYLILHKRSRAYETGSSQKTGSRARDPNSKDLAFPYNSEK